MYTLHCGDCLEYMATMADNSVDAIVTDPPYFKVKNEAWDRQWDTPTGFIAWLDTILEQVQRILRPNGSLYLFASPRMAARVEVAIGERFNVLNHIVWQKEGGTRANQASKKALRCFFGDSERVIFAEHYGADNIAKGEAGYAAKCDELRGFVFEPLRAYLISERQRAGLKRTDIRNAYANTFSNKGAGITGHYWDRSQWALPTEDMYEWLRSTLSSLNHGGAYLQRPYEELRTEYEELRRPFNVTADVPYTDVWTFPTVQAYKGKHPCEKPTAMMEHIVNSSTRAGAIVFDPFMGSGSTGVACRNLGRAFVGCDLDMRWVNRTRARIESAAMQPALLEVA